MQCRPPGRARRPPHPGGAGKVVRGPPQVEDDLDRTQSGGLLLHHGPNERVGRLFRRDGTTRRPSRDRSMPLQSPRLSRIRDLGGAFERSRRDQPSSDAAVMPHTPSSSEGRPSACHACRVSSDSVVLGPVTAVQSGFGVWGRRARSGEIWRHTGRPPARCPWFGSFSGGPRSEPDWHLSAHPALQRLSRAVRGWLPPAACTQDSRRRFGVLHYAYLPASGILQPPGPLRPAGGFPALPGGALLPRLLRGLCHRGTRVR